VSSGVFLLASYARHATDRCSDYGVAITPDYAQATELGGGSDLLDISERGDFRRITTQCA
jgi:hypothetical protein